MCEWIPAPRQIDGAKHELLLNHLFVVVTENRDGLKNKWSSPGLQSFQPTVVAAPSLRMHRLAAFRSLIPGTEPHLSKICGGQFVRSLSAAPISFRRSRVDQVAVQIKSAQKSRLMGLHPWFNKFQCIFIHEK